MATCSPQRAGTCHDATDRTGPAVGGNGDDPINRPNPQPKRFRLVRAHAR